MPRHYANTARRAAIRYDMIRLRRDDCRHWRDAALR